MSGFAGNAGNWPSQQSPHLSSNGFPYGSYDTRVTSEARNHPSVQMQSLPKQQGAPQQLNGYSNEHRGQPNSKTPSSPHAQVRQLALSNATPRKKPFQAPHAGGDAQQREVPAPSSAAEKTKRTGFIDILPPYAYRMPNGPRPLHFTIAEILVILPKWFQQSAMIKRFMYNGLNSLVHIAIMREYRLDAQALTDDQVRKATAGLTDLYRKAMRRYVEKGWTQKTQSIPHNWDGADADVSQFVPDEYYENSHERTPPIPFKALQSGLSKLPQLSDAGDLTRALVFASKHQKRVPSGQAEFMFPDDIHMILGMIGYTDIAEHQTDSNVIDRYHQEQKRPRTDFIGGTPAHTAKRRKRAQTHDSERAETPFSNAETPQLQTAQMANPQYSESSQRRTPQQFPQQMIDPRLHQSPHQMIDPRLHQPPQQQQRAARTLSSLFLPSSVRHQKLQSGPAQAASTQFYSPGARTNMHNLIRQHKTFAPGQGQHLAPQAPNMLPQVPVLPSNNAGSPFNDVAMSPSSVRAIPLEAMPDPFTSPFRFFDNGFQNGLTATLEPHTDDEEQSVSLEEHGDAFAPAQRGVTFEPVDPDEYPIVPSSLPTENALQTPKSEIVLQSNGWESSSEGGEEPLSPRSQPRVPQQNGGGRSSPPATSEIEIARAAVRPTAPSLEQQQQPEPFKQSDHIDPATGIFTMAFEDVPNMPPFSPDIKETIQQSWNRLEAEAALGGMTALEALEQKSSLNGLLTPSPEPADDQWAYLNDLPFMNSTQYPDATLLKDCVEGDNLENFTHLAQASRWCKRHEVIPYRVGHVDHVIEMAAQFGY